MTRRSRSRPLPDRLPTDSNTDSTAVTRGRSRVWITIALLLFLVVFACQPFSSGLTLRRIWLLVLPLLTPEVFLNNITEGQLVTVSDRVIPFLVSLLILLACYGAGFPADFLLPRDRAVSRGERFFWNIITGMVLFSLFLTFLSLMGLVGRRSLIGLVTLIAAAGGVIRFLWFKSLPLRSLKKDTASGSTANPVLNWCLAIVAGLLFLIYVAGSLIPTSEYDMLEYHLQGSREIFESGRLAFCNYNIYRNMPFGTEMFFVWGMVATNSVLTGALAGKAFIALLAGVTCWGLGGWLARVTERGTVGLLAAVIYLAMPGNMQVFTIGLNDGVLGMAVLAACLACSLLYRARTRQEGTPIRAAVLAGLAAGLAVSVKYTGMVFVAIPLLFPVAVVAPSGTRWKVITTLILVALLTGGIWYARNLPSTGNPVYPLATSLFGDRSRDWGPDQVARWHKAHSASSRSLSQVGNRVTGFAMTESDASVYWGFLLVLSGSVFIIGVRGRHDFSRESALFVAALTGYLFFFLLLWFLATHQISRFLVPAFPVLAAAVALEWHLLFRGEDGRTRFSLLPFLLAAFLGGATGFLMQSGYAAPLHTLYRDSLRYGDWAVWFSDHPDLFHDTKNENRSRLLLVADGNAFAYQVPVLYATCWNQTCLGEILAGSVQLDANGSNVIAVTDASRIRQRLAERGIRFILLNELELARFRSSGNYGFTDNLVQPELFRLLEQAGILRPFRPVEWPEFQESTRRRIPVWEVCP